MCVYMPRKGKRERARESEVEKTSTEQGDERGESEMRKRERHCRADSELDLNPGQGERMIVGSRRKEKGGGERARPRKLLSISSSRDRLHFLPRPPRGARSLLPRPSRHTPSRHVRRSSRCSRAKADLRGQDLGIGITIERSE